MEQVADEALADESEASDDALDRAEAALRAQRRARKNSAAGATRTGSGRGRNAAAATADGGLRRSRRPSSKDTRKTEAAALVQNLQSQRNERGRNSHSSRQTETKSPAASGRSSTSGRRIRSAGHKRHQLSSPQSGSSEDDLDLALYDEEDEIESSSADVRTPATTFLLSSLSNIILNQKRGFATRSSHCIAI